MSQNLFYLTIAVHVSGVIITHLQEHKTTVTAASGNRHVEQLSDKINSVTCASCWDFYIRILLRCTDPCILNLNGITYQLYT
jgi:hypothetical protein